MDELIVLDDREGISVEARKDHTYGYSIFVGRRHQGYVLRLRPHEARLLLTILTDTIAEAEKHQAHHKEQP